MRIFLKTMKIYKTEITKGKKIIIPGMLWTDGRDVYVSTKEKGISLKLIDFQIEGRKRMRGREFFKWSWTSSSEWLV